MAVRAFVILHFIQLLADFVKLSKNDSTSEKHKQDAYV
jgi:hypothetical protein